MKKKQSKDESGSRKGRSKRRLRGPRNNKNRGGKDDSGSCDNCGNKGHWVKYCHSLMKAHVFLGSNGDDKYMEGRYLDTGTTSLMTGRAEAFSELYHAVQGTVRFGNGLRVWHCDVHRQERREDQACWYPLHPVPQEQHHLPQATG
jgi:hypothetical protein